MANAESVHEHLRLKPMLPMHRDMHPSLSLMLLSASLTGGCRTYGSNSHDQTLSKQQRPWPGRPLSQSGRGRNQRRSTVPDHVRHPDKYTCYILDEPLLVGGGDEGAGDAGRADLEKVCLHMVQTHGLAS